MTVSSSNSLIIHRTMASFRAMRRKMMLTKHNHPNGSASASSPPMPLKVGFVPTMGALHEGHLSLLRYAQSQNDVVICSIYVNPTQFGPTEDLTTYPRSLERDIELLKSTLNIENVHESNDSINNESTTDHHHHHHLLAPTDSLYHPNHATFVTPSGMEHVLLEGQARPGHFTGVATIVMKLFNIVQPTTAYFGQKDAAQCCVIRRMVQDLNMDDHLNIHVCPTLRDVKDGLALSSRNAYLSPEERIAAPIVYQSLCAAQTLFRQHCAVLQEQENDDDSCSTGKATKTTSTSNATTSTSTTTTTLSPQQLRRVVLDTLYSEPLVSEVQYVSVDDYDTMEPLQDDLDVNTFLQSTSTTTTTTTSDDDNASKSNDDGKAIIISLACKVGSVRLIDNIVLRR